MKRIDFTKTQVASSQTARDINRGVILNLIGRLPRGRRPTFLRLNDRRAILVADLRPAQTTVAVADVNGNFLSRETMPTTSDPRATAAGIAARIRHLAEVH